MLYDRSYMRTPTGRGSPSFLAWFLGALVLVYVLQEIARVWFRSDFLVDFGALRGDSLRSGHLWSLLSYAVLHGSLSHLLFNGLGLFFLGRALQEDLGGARLAQLTLVGAIGAAIAWAGVNFQRQGYLVGASGVAMAYLAVFACLHPRRPITLLLFFVLPVTILPIWMATLFGGIELMGLLFKELPYQGSLYGVAHSAHLGGLAAGWLYHRFVLAPVPSGTSIETPAWFRRRADKPAPHYKVNLPPAAARPERTTASGPASAPASTTADSAAIRAEVDRILDKINLQGFGALTAEERRTLDDARRHLHPR